MQKDAIIVLFKDKGLRVTPQRIAVYDYLVEHRTHPDVETVYQYVLKDNPSFSKTTVYNALKSLEEAKLIWAIKIDETRVHYDAYTKLHGHFKCEKCGNIYDFEIKSLNDNLDGFQINQKDVYYCGICPTCIK